MKTEKRLKDIKYKITSDKVLLCSVQKTDFGTSSCQAAKLFDSDLKRKCRRSVYSTE